MVSGIILGFCAALCQSMSYIFSRNFVTRQEKSAFALLVLSHVIMGILSVGAILFVWPTKMPSFASYRLTLAGATGAYLIGQCGLFMALRSAQASRVAPLLGLKVLILAVISSVFLNQVLSVPQWVAVGVSVTSAILLNQIGGRLTIISIMWILVACLGYSFSDLEIKRLVDTFRHLSLMHASVLAVSMGYLTSGVIAACFIPVRKFTKKQWIDAMPFSFAWLAGMVFLFACFASIGVIFGNIIQSGRGLISIALGALVARAGYVALEEKSSVSLLFRRTAAAVLMLFAIVLFYLG